PSGRTSASATSRTAMPRRRREPLRRLEPTTLGSAGSTKIHAATNRAKISRKPAPRCSNRPYVSIMTEAVFAQLDPEAVLRDGGQRREMLHAVWSKLPVVLRHVAEL